MFDRAFILKILESKWLTAGEVRKELKVNDKKEVEHELAEMFSDGYLRRRYRIRTYEYRAAVRADIFDKKEVPFVQSLFRTPLLVS